MRLYAYVTDMSEVKQDFWSWCSLSTACNHRIPVLSQEQICTLIRAIQIEIIQHKQACHQNLPQHRCWHPWVTKRPYLLLFTIGKEISLSPKRNTRHQDIEMHKREREVRIGSRYQGQGKPAMSTEKTGNGSRTKLCLMPRPERDGKNNNHKGALGAGSSAPQYCLSANAYWFIDSVKYLTMKRLCS